MTSHKNSGKKTKDNVSVLENITNEISNKEQPKKDQISQEENN